MPGAPGAQSNIRLISISSQHGHVREKVSAGHTEIVMAVGSPF
jgi:hypothetical protein